MKSFLKNHPLTLAIVALVLSRLAGLGVIKILQAVNPNLSIQKDLGWLLMLVFAAVAVIIAFWTGTAESIGLKKTPSFKEWLLWLPALILLVPIFLDSSLHLQSYGFNKNLLLIIAAVGVAVNEEVLYRGFLLNGFLRFGRYSAIFIPSILFGISHLGNIFVGGNITFGIMQSIWTTADGVAISAMRLRNKSLYPLIIWHIIMDGTEYFATGEYGVHSGNFSSGLLALYMSLNVLFAVYALFLLSRSEKREKI